MGLRYRDLLIRPAIAIAGAAVAASLTPFFQTRTWPVYDLLQRLFPAERVDGVALIDVDQASLDALNKDGIRFPFERSIWGGVAKVAAAAGAKAITFDIIFSEASSHNVFNPEAGNKEPYTCSNPVYADSDDCIFASLLKEAAIPAIAPAPSPGGDIKAPYVLVAEGLNLLGAAHVHGEDDGVFRRMPDEVLGADGKLIPSFGQLMREKAFGPPPAPHPSPYLHFAATDAFPRIPLYNVITAYRKHFEEGQPLPESVTSLKDKVWLVGYTAGGLLDLKPTPTDRRAPGMILHATALSNRLTGDSIRMLGATEAGVIGLACCILVLLLTSVFKMPSTALSFGALAAISGPIVATLALWTRQYWISPIALMAGTTVANVAHLGLRFQREWRERLRLVRNLEHQMSPEMVQLIRSGQVEVSRFGEKREVTVLFSDLEGFTGIAEFLDPAELVEFMNGYFEEVVHLIFENRGYVDKFIGDAVMALWNAPVKSPGHAREALQAAVRYYDAVQDFNRKIKEKYPDFPRFASRVGMHTGPAVAGNIGASRRYNYTVFGDTVNLASRLEGMGKKYEVYLLISEDTVKAADAESMPGLFEIDAVSVKGRQRPTRIFSFAGADASSQIEFYKMGLAAYRQALWAEAIDSFKKAPDLGPSEVMIARCQDAIDNGPSPFWRNGVWVHDSK